MQERPKVFAIVLATIAASVLPTLVVGGVTYPGAIAQGWEREFWILVRQSLIVVSLHAVLIGLPGVLWLLRTNRLRLGPILCVGAGAGALPMALLTLPVHEWMAGEGDTWGDWAEAVLLGAGTGVVCAVLFYAVIRAAARRPSAA